MINHTFAGLGTVWKISIDIEDESLTTEDQKKLWAELKQQTNEFDQGFSRFIEGSQTTAFRNADAGIYPISEQLSELLVVADRLRRLTDGAYDPAIGGLLEAAGYGQGYRLKPDPDQLKNWRLPNWSLDAAQRQLTLDGSVIFDLGGMGKGYWIDRLSQFLLNAGYPFHIVEGGGDMMATSKKNGEGWWVALEWPGRRDMALGVVELHNQGLAASDTFKRHWGEWHHLVDLSYKLPVKHLAGCIVVADNAWQADQLTSALSLSQAEKYPALATELKGEYVVILKEGQARVSAGWPGELF